MVVGIITIFSMLFGPGAIDMFFMPDFDKGVKEYVIDKERQKEILVDIKEAQKIIKAYNKLRKSDFKQFQDMNASSNTTESEFMSFFSDVQATRKSTQNELIDIRISMARKIEQSEWDSILVYSTASFNKTLEKAKKKANKKGDKGFIDSFEKTRATVLETVDEIDKQKAIINGFDGLISNVEELLTALNSVNTNGIPDFVKKEASKEDLLGTANKINDARALVYKELVGFHKMLKENTTEEEWGKVIKVFNKEMAITNH